MPGRPLKRKITEAREQAERQGRDPDQAERDLRQKLGMSPMDDLDRQQREEKAPLAVDEPTIPADLDDANIGPDGKPMSERERLKRDAAIIQLLNRGISPESAGAQFGLSGSRVRRLKKEWMTTAPDQQDLDPSGLVRDTMANYEAAIEELALVAARSGHGPTKVAAIRVRLEALRGRMELLQSVGVVPHDLGQIRVLDDAQFVARQIADVFERFGVSDEVTDAVLDVIEGRQPQLPPGDVVDAEVVEETTNGSNGHP